MNAKIVQVTGRNCSFTLDKETFSFGRGKENDIVITGNKVSRKHALITKRAKGFYLEDADSTNGILYKGRRIRSAHLKNNDTFIIGRFEFRYVEEEPLYEHKIPEQYTLPEKNYCATFNHPTRSSAVPWVIGSIVFIVMLVLGVLFLPIYSVSAGTITSCKKCGKEVNDDVRTFNTSFFDKDNPKYNIERSISEYCSSCGNEKIAFSIYYYCEFCKQNYKTENLFALRREEKKDEQLTRGFCNNLCALGGKIEEKEENVKEVIDKVTNPLEMLK